MKPYINPYFHFDGNCREAVTFYEECFGGELQIQTLGESPSAEQFPEDQRDSVMHAHLKSGDIELMASDMFGDQKQVLGNAVSLNINCKNEGELRRYFDRLSSGGKVIDPVKKQFWGDLFGICTDKFGITWMVNCEL